LKFRLEAIQKHFSDTAVYLDTTHHSSPFYEKFGFQLTKVVPDYFEAGMHKHELIYQF
jgi:predicted GNAT family N-acyltransferase